MSNLSKIGINNLLAKYASGKDWIHEVPQSVPGVYRATFKELDKIYASSKRDPKLESSNSRISGIVNNSSCKQKLKEIVRSRYKKIETNEEETFWTRSERVELGKEYFLLLKAINEQNRLYGKYSVGTFLDEKEILQRTAARVGFQLPSTE